MNQKLKIILVLILGCCIGYFVKHIFDTYTIEKRSSEPSVITYNSPSKSSSDSFDYGSSKSQKSENTKSQNRNSSNIDELTEENLVINYVKKNHELPDYYITKNEARQQGWVASQGNLCDVLPGRAIGGDKFSNREGTLPKGELYYEADVNYNCGRRNADRIVFTKDGDVYLTKNHYKSFEKQ